MPIASLLFTGIAQGCIYGLVALSFVLIYKATEAVSFAQGDLMMLGAFLGLAAKQLAGFDYWVAIPSAVAATALVGLLAERAVVRPLLGQPVLSVVLLTLGLGYMLRGGVTLVPGLGTDTHRLPTPYDGLQWQLGQMPLDATLLVVVGATALLCVLLYLGFSRTRIGIAMQAASQNQLAAAYMGIPVSALTSLVWALAAGVAAVAGLLLAPITFVHAGMGLLGLKAFPAAVVGGFGSLPGALVGGLLIGLVEAFAGFYLPEGFKDVAPYVVVLVVLAVRPHGLFGESLRKKV
jgi:branched-chain amino acid transport system permease protein